MIIFPVYCDIPSENTRTRQWSLSNKTEMKVPLVTQIWLSLLPLPLSLTARVRDDMCQERDF